MLWGSGDVHEGTSVRTQQRKLSFFGYGGHYEVFYDWYFTDWVAGSGSQL